MRLCRFFYGSCEREAVDFGEILIENNHIEWGTVLVRSQPSQSLQRAVRAHCRHPTAVKPILQRCELSQARTDK